ncbi:MAG: hypothetical protein ACD_79C00719G0005 [uncultured bacterium]|nr:MAG: hypothetical protein ACD_79C00719G0005 [uncultured bacterium]
MVKVSSVVENLPPSGIRIFFDLVLTMDDDVISLGVGEPDFATPWHISDYAIDKIEKGYNTYTSNSGLMELRKEISKYLTNTYSVEYNPENEILITVGVSEGLDIALRSLIEPGDEVLVVDPSYVAYSPLVTLAGGIAKSIKTTKESDFKLKPADLQKACSKKSKILLINYPCNPTGTTYTMAELKALSEVIIKNDLFVISDEIYHQLTFDHEHTMFASIPGIQERALTLNGFSKGYAMTGWRVGYACGPKNVIAAMTKIHQYNILSVPAMGQYAAIEALRNGEKAVIEMAEEYKRRRNFIVQRLNEIGLSCHKPGGTFYVFPEIPANFSSGIEFANRLLKEKKVALVPGNAFGDDHHIRISCASSMKKIQTAMEKVESFVKGV